MEKKKNLLTKEGLKQYEDELYFLKKVKRDEISQKIKEATDQGDLSENAEYDAAKDEQRDVEARIVELENLLKNAEVVEIEKGSGKSKNISFGSTVKVLDIEFDEELEFQIKGSSETDSLKGSISNESPLGAALMGCKKGDVIEVEAPMGVIKYKIIDFHN